MNGVLLIDLKKIYVVSNREFLKKEINCLHRIAFERLNFKSNKYH